MNSIFKDLVDVTDNEWAVVMSEGDETNVNRYIDTGSYTFNALLSGSMFDGAAGNRVTALAGEPATGKTYFAISICKQFLQDNPSGYIFYFESENAISQDMLVERGLPVDRFAYIPVETVQDFRTQALRVLNKYLELPKADRDANPLMFVLDSLGNLSTQKEMEDIQAGNSTRDMTRAQLIRGCFRALNLKLGRAGVPLIMTNHIYETIGTYVAMKEMSGGQGAKYAASTIIFLSKKKRRETSGDKEVSGVIITATTNKSRLSIENRSVETLLDYKQGLHRYYGLVDLALKFGVWKKSGNYVETDRGKFFEKEIYREPEKHFTQDVLDKLNTYCMDEFLYGSTSVAEVKDDDAI